jgi:diguanylate cyclase (GGDEF)-like protein
MSLTSRLIAYLEKQSRVYLWLAVLVAVLGLGIIDYETGPGISLSLFYVFPIALAAWTLGKYQGVFIALVCAALWDGLILPMDEFFGGMPISIWNGIVRFGLLLIISLLLTEIHTILKRESRLSRTDFLTGLLNRRALTEATRVELERLTRTGQPFTFLYMDLDNFKSINDALGHNAGDALLISVASMLQFQLRGIDVVARMGGDEFVAVLPNTNEEASRKVTTRLQNALLEKFREHRYPITFSMGALTCYAASSNMDEIFRWADQLLYEAKQSGKNTICHRTI